jgi:hypothetical protein
MGPWLSKLEGSTTDNVKSLILRKQSADGQNHYDYQAEWPKKIADLTKRVEYQEIKPYWVKRLSQVQVPFLLRLINGI